MGIGRPESGASSVEGPPEVEVAGDGQASKAAPAESAFTLPARVEVALGRSSSVGAWSVEHARLLAAFCAPQEGDRWKHVQAVGNKAERLAASHPEAVSSDLAIAAWLHDVGYYLPIAHTGLHALDGAFHLMDRGLSAAITSLVAHHSGATIEARERNLIQQLQEFPPPPRDDLDILTYIDMTTGPTGDDVAPMDRLDEILHRYDTEHPVHRAVTQSRQDILRACDRAAGRLILSH